MKTWTRLFSLLLLGALACSDSENPAGPEDPGEDPDGKADVSGTFNGLQPWSQLSPPVTPSQDQLEGDPTGSPAQLPESDPRYSGAHLCTTTPYSLAKNPEELITLSSNEGLLVPGVLLQGKSHVLGSLQQLSIDQRTPIDLVIDQSSALVPGRTVDQPSLTSLRAGVNSLIQDAETSGFEHASSVFFEQVTSYSTEQAALGLGISARYMGAEARGQLDTETSASTTTVTARFIQRAFTIRADGPSFAPDWFTDDFTEEVLQQYLASGQISEDNPPLFVLSVTYGRIVMVNFTANESRETTEGVFEAGYKNGVGSLKGKLTASQEELLRNSELRVVSLGGPAEGGFQFAKEILNPDDEDSIGLDGFFAQDVALTTFVPISYTIADLRTGNVVTVGETSEYEVLDCATRAESDFEDGREGWSALYGRPGDPTWRQSANTARSGSGYITVTEDNNLTTYLTAPGKFLGNKALYAGGQLTYWVNVDCGTPVGSIGADPDCLLGRFNWSRSSGAGDLIIESDDSPKILVGRMGRDNVGRYTWVQRVINLTPGPDMWVYNPSMGESQSGARPATQEDILEVLSNISRLRIKAEFMSGAVDWVFVDDVRMIPPEAPAPVGAGWYAAGAGW